MEASYGMSDKSKLQTQLERVILCVGDIIVDTISGGGGTLIARRRHIDIEEDDVYLWEIKWFNIASQEYVPSPIREESELKLSIVGLVFAALSHWKWQWAVLDSQTLSYLHGVSPRFDTAEEAERWIARASR